MTILLVSDQDFCFYDCGNARLFSDFSVIPFVYCVQPFRYQVWRVFYVAMLKGVFYKNSKTI